MTKEQYLNKLQENMKGQDKKQKELVDIKEAELNKNEAPTPTKNKTKEDDSWLDAF